jgi:hypothetical protein
MSLPRHRRAKTVPVTVVASENGHSPTVTITAAAVPEQDHEPTQVIEGVTPSLALDFASGLRAAELGLTEDLGTFADYAREPIPDLYSADPADRTEWFTVEGGSEPLFEALVTELDAMWLLDTSLPVPVRTAPEAAEAAADSGPEASPPAGEDSGPDAAQASPGASGPVSTEDEPAKDEPEAEPDCAEGSDAQ